MQRSTVGSKNKAMDRHEVRNHLTNLLFEGEVKRACREALDLWQRGEITAEDYRFIQSNGEFFIRSLHSQEEISFRQRLVE